MNLNDEIAREIIRERAAASRLPRRRPTHPRAARMLRRLAERMDASS